MLRSLVGSEMCIRDRFLKDVFMILPVGGAAACKYALLTNVDTRPWQLRGEDNVFPRNARKWEIPLSIYNNYINNENSFGVGKREFKWWTKSFIGTCTAHWYKTEQPSHLDQVVARRRNWTYAFLENLKGTDDYSQGERELSPALNRQNS